MKSSFSDISAEGHDGVLRRSASEGFTAVPQEPSAGGPSPSKAVRLAPLSSVADPTDQQALPGPPIVGESRDDVAAGVWRTDAASGRLVGQVGATAAQEGSSGGGRRTAGAGGHRLVQARGRSGDRVVLAHGEAASGPRRASAEDRVGSLAELDAHGGRTQRRRRGRDHDGAPGGRGRDRDPVRRAPDLGPRASRSTGARAARRGHDQQGGAGHRRRIRPAAPPTARAQPDRTRLLPARHGGAAFGVRRSTTTPSPTDSRPRRTAVHGRWWISSATSSTW